jgi:hypothetical protein
MDHINGKLIFFNKEREQRLISFRAIKESLWAKLLEYTSNVLNLREKVRAKHLFCRRLGLEPETLLEPFWHVHLQAWIVLEYRNIRNDRSIDLFIKEHRSQLTEAEWVMIGQFMATYLSVYDIQKVENQLELVDIFSQEKIIVPIEPSQDEPLGIVQQQISSSPLMVGRLLRIGPSYGVLEPFHMLNHFSWDVERRIQKEYEMFKADHAAGSWRSFMQLNGIGVLLGCKGNASFSKGKEKWRRKDDKNGG